MRRPLPGLVAAALIFHTNSWAAGTFAPPAGWMTVPPPDAARLTCASYSRLKWTVTMRNGSVAIDQGRSPGDALPPELAAASDALRPRSSLHVLPVDDGYLVGRFAGEFGGDLTWFRKDGKKSAVLGEKPVVALISIGQDKALSLEGVNHGFIQAGTARWLTRASGTWGTTRTTRLEEAPYTVAAGDHEAYVVGPEWLTVVSFDGGVTKLQSLPLRGLYPSSMAREDDGVLWVGARQFVLRLVPQGAGQPFAVTWLLPEGCRTTTKRGPDCVCGN